MNNSLYKFTLYFFFMLFISSCFTSFDRSEALDNKPKDQESSQITEQTKSKITEINNIKKPQT